MSWKVDTVGQENRKLKKRLEQLERENRDLKKSLFDLSARYNGVLASTGREVKPFSIEEMLTESAEKVESKALDKSLNEEPDMTKRLNNSSQATAGGKAKQTKKKQDGRLLHYKYDLKGHNGSVYTVQFSHSGRLLASGGFDKSVRVWDIEKPMYQEEVMRLQQHNLNVSDLSWSNDSQFLLSGAFDRTAKLWDMTNGNCAQTFNLDDQGFVQSVLFNPTDNNIFFVGTTHKSILMFDLREGKGHTAAGGCAASFQNGVMINTLYVNKDGATMLSGDRHGCVKTWDIGSRKPIESIQVGSEAKPVSHITVCGRGEEEGRLLAVNSYDNVLRVYDRGGLDGHRLECMHLCKGHKNKNWPIRSSLYQGLDYNPFSRTNSLGDSKDGPQDLKDKRQNHWVSQQLSEDSKASHTSVHDTVLLATGSADNYAYIFDVGGPKGSSELVQRLEGHTDRVYAVNYHPQEPILASCSADFTIKIWQAKAQRNHAITSH